MADLRIKALGKAYGDRPVLHELDLEVASGKLVALLGPSGSGKTTLLRLITGFDRPDAGTIEIGGQLVSGPGVLVAPEQRQIGYVAQEGALFPHLTIADNIVFGLPRRLRRQHAKVAELLDLAGLPAAYAGRWPHQLSGGEQQRVALARALAPEPRLVLLDEPFSSLDAALRVETREAVAQALAATRATALLVTHDQGEALSMGDEVAVLRRGKLVQRARPETLYRRPVDIELARFVGDAVVLPGIAAGTVAECSLGRLPLAAACSGPVDLLIRPEQIRLIQADQAPRLQAEVLRVVFYGHDAVLSLALAGDRQSVLTARCGGQLCPRPGDRVGVRVEGDVVAFASAEPSRQGSVLGQPAVEADLPAR